MTIETAAHFDYAQREGFERVYPQAQDLPEAEQAEYDALALLMEEDEGLTEAQEARLEELEAMTEAAYTPEQAALAGLWVRVDYQGVLATEPGLVSPEDVAEAVESGALGAVPERTRAAAGKADASPYSGALAQDLRAIRLAAVQTALLAKPELVLDLLAFGFSAASGVGGSVFGIRPDRPMNKPAAAEGLAFDDRLAHPLSGHEAWGRPELRVDDMVDAFNGFQAEGKKARNAAITAGIARTLPYGAEGKDFFAHIETLSGARIRDVWTPTAAGFFGRVSADYLTDLLAELLDADADDKRVKSFKSQKKGAKAEAMERLFADPEYQAAMGVTAEQRKRIADWVPGDVF